MGWLDDDIYEDPSEAESIIDDAEEKLFDLLKGEIKAAQSNWRSRQDEIGRLDNKIYEKECKLKRLTEEIRRAEEKAENLESGMPQKYIDSFVRKYTGNLAPGDKVWIAESKCHRDECPVCKGKKKVQAEVGGYMVEVICPKCNGWGHLDRYEYFPAEKTISEVRLKLCFEKGYPVRPWTADTINISGKDYYEKRGGFYRTKEEAQAACDKLNKDKEE